MAHRKSLIVPIGPSDGGTVSSQGFQQGFMHICTRPDVPCGSKLGEKEANHDSQINSHSSTTRIDVGYLARPYHTPWVRFKRFIVHLVNISSGECT